MLAGPDAVAEGSEFGEEPLADTVVGQIIAGRVVGDKATVIVLPERVLMNTSMEGCSRVVMDMVSID